MMLSIVFTIVTAISPPSQDSSRATQFDREAELAWGEARFEQSLSLFRESLARRTSEDPAYAGVLGNIAELERTLGRFREAERDARRSLALRQKALGPNHPDVAGALNNLGEVLRSKRENKAAEELYRKALAILDSQASPDPRQQASVRSNLGHALTRLKKFDEAEASLRRAIELWKASGEKGPDRAVSMNNLAVLLVQRGRHREASDLYREVLAIVESSLPPGHLTIGLVRVNLADALRRQKRYEESAGAFQVALKAITQSVGHDHPERATALGMFALLLRETGRRNEAKQMLAESREIRQRHARTDGSGMVVDARSL